MRNGMASDLNRKFQAPTLVAVKRVFAGRLHTDGH